MFSCSKEKSPYMVLITCRTCHDKFYQLWSTSFHGLAMKHLSPQAQPLTIGHASYQAEVGGKTGYVRETGPGGEKKYEIKHVMGGTWGKTSLLLSGG